MAFPTTSNNLSSAHSAGQTITSADVNAIAVDADQLTLKVGTGASTPTAGTELVGTGTGTSAWVATGSLTQTARSALFTLASTDDVSFCTGTWNLTLPAANTLTSKPYYIKNVSTGVITIVGTVDGASNPTLSLQYDAIILIPETTANLWRSF